MREPSVESRFGKRDQPSGVEYIPPLNDFHLAGEPIENQKGDVSPEKKELGSGREWLQLTRRAGVA